MKLATSMIVLLCLTVFGASSVAILPPTDRDLEGLVGLVKKIDEETSEMKMKGGKLVEGSRRPAQTVFYDRQGRMTRRWISISGFDRREQSFSYDKENRRFTRRSAQSPTVGGGQGIGAEQISLTVFRFDAAENSFHEEVYADDKPSPKSLTQKYSYLFDESNRLIRKSLFSVEGTEAIREVYLYETDRHPSERQLYVRGMPRPQVIRYTYTLDPQGNWIKRVAENTLADRNGTQRVEVTYRKISYY